MKTYHIWKQYHSGDWKWTLTDHSVKARSDKEAQSKVRRKFAIYGFTAMSLMAVIDGSDPNR